MPKWSTYLEALPSAWLWAARDGSDLVLLTAFVSRDWLPGGKAGIASRVRRSSGTKQVGPDERRPENGRFLPASVKQQRVLRSIKLGLSHLRVGDASLALDPIASQGCQQALISGFQGAAVVHTCLSSPSAYPLAEEFVLARLQETIALHVRHTREAYQQQSPISDPFWSVGICQIHLH